MRTRLSFGFDKYKVRSLLVAFAFVAIAIGGSWTLFSEIGRTPGELIRYAERRLQGHPKLEFVVLPIMGGLRFLFGEPGYRDPPSRFFVPPLSPNPAPGYGYTGPNIDAPDLGHDNASAPNGGRRTIRVGHGRTIATIASAAKLARDGDIIEIDAGDYRGDVAVWDRAALTIRGVGGHIRLIASGADAEGKAIWVIRRGAIMVENIEFIGARVSERNGAGIRFESGHLIVRNCLFFNNENGLLTSGGDAELEIENSEFGYNGAGDGQSHNLYVGKIRSLTVTGSYFHHANVGHLLKSRAEKNFIAYNRLSDESGGRASYELEFPSGGVAYVIGNIIQQTARASNSTLISFGAEGYSWPNNQLFLVNNTLVNADNGGGTFLRVMPGALVVRTQNNLLAGKGRFHTPDIRESTGDMRADWNIFAQPLRYDYRLNPEGRKHTAPPAGIVNGVDMSPNREYIHPRQLKKLPAAPLFPGALQTPGPA